MDLPSFIGYVRRTPMMEDANLKRRLQQKSKVKKFISPIDKLLKKNGSSAESDDPDLPIKKEKIEIFYNQVPIEAANDENYDEIAAKQSNEEEEFQLDNGGTSDLAEMPNKYQLDMNRRENNFDHMQSAEGEKVSAQTSKMFSFRSDVKTRKAMALKLSENLQENEISGGINEQSDWEIDNRTLTAAQDGSSKTEESTKTLQEEFSEAKSPSAVSMDSAIDSSIVTESSWKAFAIGDLFWGQLLKYPYWPCMVCPEPEGESSNGNQQVFVRFFADKGRGNWIKRENLIPFTTLTSYQDLLDEYRDKYGAKSIEFKRLVPRHAYVPKWRAAASEMEKVAAVSHGERLDVFNDICKNMEAIQKQERHRRKSLNLLRGHHYMMTNSDAESYCSSTDITASSGNFKRRRSVSPYRSASTLDKKRNVRENNVEQFLTIGNNINGDVKQQPRQFLSADITGFETFYSGIKEFALEGYQNKIFEKSLFESVRNIWTLKVLSHQHMQLRQRTFESNGGIPSTRFSSRKAMSMQRSPLLVDLPVVATAKTKEEAREPLNEDEKLRRGHIVNRPMLEVIDDIFNLDNKYLFEGMTRDPVCKYCFKPAGDLKKCTNNCSTWIHIGHEPITLPKRTRKRLKSVKNAEDDSPLCSAPVDVKPDEDVMCRECANNESAKCAVCNLTDSMQADDPLVKCHMAQCHKVFHPACSKKWPQSKITISKNHIQSFRCPSHVCHTCVSDNPKGKFQHISNAKLIKCVKCPATYHMDSTCIPAGSQILTAAHILCPRHSILKTDMNVNVNWCFICGGVGGQVFCCETCPAAVHAQCLKIPIDPNQGYICDECESGRMPLYGEMVWAKFNNFRWWPAIILPPTEIPKNIAKKSHNPADFVVRFFGTHDHGWISRRRVYLYVEGDVCQPPKSRSNIDQNYQRGLNESKQVYEIIKAKKLMQRNANESKETVHPQPYARIKVNRAVSPVKLHPDFSSVSKCDCDPNDANPCGPESNCLNRALYHECNPKMCPAGKRCQNQLFESRVSPRMDVVHMKDRGFGLVAREPISAGTFIIEYVGEVINDAEFKARMSQKSADRDEHFYFLLLEKDLIIDAGPRGNLARFMNHSCDPNCETQKWCVNSLNRIGLFAIKDIAENTELTFNYHWDELLGNEKTPCYCGAIKCAGHIGGKIKIDSKEPSSPISENTQNSKAIPRGAKPKQKRRRNK